MRATVIYTISRILLFVAVLLVLRLAGASGLLAIGLALLISALVSYVLLWRQREAMAGSVSARLRSLRGRLDAGAAAEDED